MPPAKGAPMEQIAVPDTMANAAQVGSAGSIGSSATIDPKNTAIVIGLSPI